MVSLLGTFAATMYALGFSLNNPTLMALTVATGFVVDDAIGAGKHHPPPGAGRGATPGHAGWREVGFTADHRRVAGGGVHPAAVHGRAGQGRMFREFAVTLSVAVMISLLISRLTTTPMLCLLLLRPAQPWAPPRQSAPPAGCAARLAPSWARCGQQVLARAYVGALDWALARPGWWWRCCWW